MAQARDADALTFSIVIPTYQGMDTVCETLRAICALTWTGSVEAIVVVDGSTDGTTDAVRQMECRFPVRVLEQPNRGLAHARNRGAGEAIGTILLFLDDDMICLPDLLHRHAETFGQGSDAVIGAFSEAGSAIAGVTSGEGVVRVFRPPMGGLSAFDIYGGHLAVRRDVFEELGGFDVSFTQDGNYGCEDREFGRRLLERHVVVGNPEAMCQHRKLINPTDYVRRARQSARSEARLLRKHPGLRDDLIRWSGAASRSKRLRLLSRVPIVPQIVAGCVAIAATAAARSPLRASSSIEPLCAAAYALNYWASVYREGALPELWGRDAVC
jgi:glycosyltransferase involved in cell wall biosynthesis